MAPVRHHLLPVSESKGTICCPRGEQGPHVVACDFTLSAQDTDVSSEFNASLVYIVADQPRLHTETLPQNKTKMTKKKNK